ncbi:unnamed protein product [Clonostachys byssicola]|uniref:Uncharacterized protein n=1 Tax=Clonostachys byssicola TaxID=160290 RepID=A0A9N9U732_9HYPO|nr:unnamed protein product [Clonostachys byssicola]
MYRDISRPNIDKTMEKVEGSAHSCKFLFLFTLTGEFADEKSGTDGAMVSILCRPNSAKEAPGSAETIGNMLTSDMEA